MGQKRHASGWVGMNISLSPEQKEELKEKTEADGVSSSERIRYGLALLDLALDRTGTTIDDLNYYVRHRTLIVKIPK